MSLKDELGGVGDRIAALEQAAGRRDAAVQPIQVDVAWLRAVAGGDAPRADRIARRLDAMEAASATSETSGPVEASEVAALMDDYDGKPPGPGTFDEEGYLVPDPPDARSAPEDDDEDDGGDGLIVLVTE